MFWQAKPSRRPSPSLDMRGLPALLPVLAARLITAAVQGKCTMPHHILRPFPEPTVEEKTKSARVNAVIRENFLSILQYIRWYYILMLGPGTKFKSISGGGP